MFSPIFQATDPARFALDFGLGVLAGEVIDKYRESTDGADNERLAQPEPEFIQQATMLPDGL
jgi:hypothetical protein